MRRIWAVLTALCLLCTPCMAEVQAPEKEKIDALMESLFAAATGTDIEEETWLRAGMTEEELLERDRLNAEYRAKMLPWLIEALQPVQEIQPEPEQTQEPEEAEIDPKEELWTIEDSFAALGERAQGRAYLDLLAGMGAESMEECMAATREMTALWIAQVDHAQLSAMNPDYAVWIYAPGTQIDYPVVHGEDNDFYLRRLFDGKRNSAGTLFIDYRNLPLFQDPNTLIYGHHMRNDSMFGTLTDYETQAYFEAHPYLLILHENEICLVELFAGYTTSDQDHCYDIAISDDEDMRLFLDTALEKSDFVSGVCPETSDRLLTLSTCAYAFRNARYILIGSLTPVWQAEVEPGAVREMDAWR